MPRLLRGFFIVLCVLMAGCANVQKLNENMERSTEMVQGNTAAVTISSQVIRENTLAVSQSTQALGETKEVIAGSTALLQQAMNMLNLHPALFPAFLILLLLALSLPSLILYCAFRTLSEKLSAQLKQK